MKSASEPVRPESSLSISWNEAGGLEMCLTLSRPGLPNQAPKRILKMVNSMVVKGDEWYPMFDETAAPEMATAVPTVMSSANDLVRHQAVASLPEYCGVQKKGRALRSTNAKDACVVPVEEESSDESVDLWLRAKLIMGMGPQ